MIIITTMIVDIMAAEAIADTNYMKMLRAQLMAVPVLFLELYKLGVVGEIDFWFCGKMDYIYYFGLV